MERTIFGTTVDIGPAGRDSVLSGGFTSIIVFAVTGSFLIFLLGLVGGAFLGVSLHLMPPEPAPGDSRSGRIINRAVSGAIAGAGVGAFFRWLFAWAHHSHGSVLGGAAMGLIAGAVWYSIWGVWETRNLTKAAARASA